MKMLALISSALFLSLMVCQCAALGTKVEMRPVWESGNAYIRLFKEVGKPKGYDQPMEFHEVEMRRILLGLYFSRYEYFRWSTSSRVFDEDEARGLASHFQKAFLEAGPDEVVEFYLPDRSRRFLGITSKTVLTRGRSFVKGDELYFQFDSVQEELKTYSTRMEDEQFEADVSWRLVPQEGQQNETDKDVLGSERTNLHVIRINLKQFAELYSGLPEPPAVKAIPPPAGPTLSAVGTSTEMTPVPKTAPPAEKPQPEKGARERLRELKKMLDEGLITREDYDSKKQKILNDL